MVIYKVIRKKNKLVGYEKFYNHHTFGVTIFTMLFRLMSDPYAKNKFHKY